MHAFYVVPKAGRGILRALVKLTVVVTSRTPGARLWPTRLRSTAMVRLRTAAIVYGPQNAAMVKYPRFDPHDPAGSLKC